MLRLTTILVGLLLVLGISLWLATDKMAVVFSLSSAMTGGLIAILGEHYFRIAEEKSKRAGVINSLRTEAELNLEIEGYKTRDEKLRSYVTSFWDQAGPYLLD